MMRNEMPNPLSLIVYKVARQVLHAMLDSRHSALTHTSPTPEPPRPH